MKLSLSSIIFLVLLPFLGIAQDTIVKKSGALRICKINKIDKEKVYFSYEQEGEEVSKFLKKTDIAAVKYETFLALDTITRNDGKVRICKIENEDSLYIYVTIKWDGRKTDAFVKKSNIKSIKRGNYIPRKPNLYYSPIPIIKADSSISIKTLSPTKSDSTKQIQQNTELTTNNKPLPIHKHDIVSIGIGAGIDHGGFGGNLLFYPQKNIGIFGALGFPVIGFGYNFGAKIRLTPKKYGNPFITAMYGYNTAIIVTNASGFNKIFYGYTFGLGYDFKPKNAKNYFTFAMLIPIRGAEVQEYIDDLETNHNAKFSNELKPITFSIGYRIVLNNRE